MLNFLRSKSFLINFIAAGLFTILVVWLIFKFIDNYTLHGETISVPSLEGLTINEVKAELNKKKLQYTILDSIYIANAEKGIVLEQNPSPGDLVKENRTIYITTSKIVPPKISMPNVVDISLRMAIAKIESYGLKVKTQHRASECVNCVLKQEIRGKEVKPGDKIKKGSVVLLTIGTGTSDVKVMVPYLVNLTLEEAESKLMEASLNLGYADFQNCLCETKEDTINAKVYWQSQIRNQSIAINIGSSVDLRLTCDSSMVKFDQTLANDTNNLVNPSEPND